MKRTAVCRKRRGITLADVAVGLVLVSTAAAALTQTVFMLAEHRSSQQQKQNAADLLGNISEMLNLETLTALQPESPEYQKIIKPLEALTARTLPDGLLKIEPLPIENDSVQIVRMTVSWDAGKQRPRRKIEFLRAVPRGKKI